MPETKARTVADLLPWLVCECGRDYLSCDEFDGHCPVCEVDSLRSYVAETKSECNSALGALVDVCELIVGGFPGGFDPIRYRLARKLIQTQYKGEKLMPLFEQAIQDIKEREAQKEAEAEASDAQV